MFPLIFVARSRFDTIKRPTKYGRGPERLFTSRVSGSYATKGIANTRNCKKWHSEWNAPAIQNHSMHYSESKSNLSKINCCNYLSNIHGTVTLVISKLFLCCWCDNNSNRDVGECCVNTTLKHATQCCYNVRHVVSRFCILFLYTLQQIHISTGNDKMLIYKCRIS